MRHVRTRDFTVYFFLIWHFFLLLNFFIGDRKPAERKANLEQFKAGKIKVRFNEFNLFLVTYVIAIPTHVYSNFENKNKRHIFDHFMR